MAIRADIVLALLKPSDESPEMPVIAIETNVKLEDSKDFVVKLSKASAQILAKPESAILAKYDYNEALCWGGTFEAAFILTVSSIGNFNPESNPSYVEEFTKFLKENLGIDDKRGYIVLQDPGRDAIGFAGTTVANLHKK